MPALQVRDFPEDLYEGLKEYAAREHRSMAQQTIQAVEEMLAQRGVRKNSKGPRIISYESLRERDAIIAKRKALFERISERAKDLPDDLPPVEEFIRERKEELEERGDRIIALVEGLER